MKDGNRWWRKLGRKSEPDRPPLEQGLYRSYRAVHPFDERFGVDTSGLVYEPTSGHPHDAYNNGYFAVAPSVFHLVMGALEKRLHLDFRRFRFVDVGSGKGRAMLLASDYPFQEVIGVELSAALERVARANVAKYPASRYHTPITSVHGDAAEFRWPAGPLIVYMWNAFTQPVMDAVLKNLDASLAEEPPRVVPGLHPSGAGDDAFGGALAGAAVARGVHDERRRLCGMGFPERHELCSVYWALPRHTTPKFEQAGD